MPKGACHAHTRGVQSLDAVLATPPRILEHMLDSAEEHLHRDGFSQGKGFKHGNYQNSPPEEIHNLCPKPTLVDFPVRDQR